MQEPQDALVSYKLGTEHSKEQVRSPALHHTPHHRGQVEDDPPGGMSESQGENAQGIRNSKNNQC